MQRNCDIKGKTDLNDETMKRILTTLTLLLLVLTITAQEKTLEQMGGVYYAYPVNHVLINPAAPEGYTPFYIHIMEDTGRDGCPTTVAMNGCCHSLPTSATSPATENVAANYCNGYGRTHEAMAANSPHSAAVSTKASERGWCRTSHRSSPIMPSSAPVRAW